MYYNGGVKGWGFNGFKGGVRGAMLGTVGSPLSWRRAEAPSTA